MASLGEPLRDHQTVTTEGESVQPLIDGVRVRPATTIPDERGSICEIYNPAWGFSDKPLVYAYVAMVRPRAVKGWVIHREQDDRLFVLTGTLQVVLYDARPGSSTEGKLNQVVIGRENRALVCVPHGVYHAVANVGEEEGTFINLPTRPYDYAKPDKYRLPLDTDEIPYRFPPGFRGS